MQERIIERLRCLSCAGELDSQTDGVACRSCGVRYPVEHGAVVFTSPESHGASPASSDALIFRLKTAFKKYDRFYYLLVRLIGPLFVGRKTGKDVSSALPPEAFVINLGSGPKHIAERVVNVDMHPFDGVDVCADAERLPFAAGSVDAVLCECILEHVPRPHAVVKEIQRVLAPGGIVYASVPFMDPYHASPDDYTRWTMPGVQVLFQGLDVQECAVAWGPISSVVAVTSHGIALLLSFGSRSLQQALALLFMTCLAPLKLLDLILARYPISSNIATGFYLIAKKPIRSLSETEQ